MADRAFGHDDIGALLAGRATCVTEIFRGGFEAGLAQRRVRIILSRSLEIDPIQPSLAGALLPAVENFSQLARAEMLDQVCNPENRENGPVMNLPVVPLREIMDD